MAAFHLHVYFDVVSRASALMLRDRIRATSPDSILGRLHENPVAFHPSAMYQVTVPETDLGAVLLKVLAERRGLSILVHPVHGDAWAEHTTDAMWIGPVLPLDRVRLRNASSAAAS